MSFKNWRRSSSSSKKLTKSQLDTQMRFQSITACSKETAVKVLTKKGINWDLSAAMHHYYDNRNLYPDTKVVQPSDTDFAKLDKIFDKYEDDDEKDTCMKSFEQLNKDLGLDWEGSDPFYLAFKCKCSSYGEMTRKEFKAGFGDMGVYTVAEMKPKLRKYIDSMKNSSIQFENMYFWLFSFLKENEQKKTIPVEIACAVMSVVLPDQRPKLVYLDDWIEFLTEEEEELKAITNDTWKNVREFLMKCKDFPNWENDGAWALLVDTFEEWWRKNKGKK